MYLQFNTNYPTHWTPTSPYISWAFNAPYFKPKYVPFVLWDADFDPPGQSQHLTKQRDGNVDCPAVLRLRLKWPISKKPRTRPPDQYRINPCFLIIRVCNKASGTCAYVVQEQHKVEPYILLPITLRVSIPHFEKESQISKSWFLCQEAVGNCTFSDGVTAKMKA